MNMKLLVFLSLVSITSGYELRKERELYSKVIDSARHLKRVLSMTQPVDYLPSQSIFTEKVERNLVAFAPVLFSDISKTLDFIRKNIDQIKFGVPILSEIDGSTENPEESTPTYPDEGTTYPEESTTYPEEGTTYPEEETSNPEESTPYPGEETPNPEGTTFPEEVTFNPEGTTYPEESTRYPEEGTPNPEGTTFPEEVTFNPEETTYPEEESTQNPEGSTEYPQPQEVTDSTPYIPDVTQGVPITTEQPTPDYTDAEISTFEPNFTVEQGPTTDFADYPTDGPQTVDPQSPTSDPKATDYPDTTTLPRDVDYSDSLLIRRLRRAAKLIDVNTQILNILRNIH